LFKEIAVDIGFALHNIELKEERNRIEEALREAHDELEMRVDERTAELVKTNEHLKQEIEGHIRAKEALRKSEERLRDFLDNANDLIQIVDPSARFTYVNRKWLEVLGYTADESINLSISDIIHPDSFTHCLEVFQRVLAGETVDKVEAVFVAKYGTEICVEGSISCRFKDGKPINTRGIFHDITDRKLAESAMRESAKKYKKLYDESKKTEEVYRSLLHTSADAIVIYDMAGKARYINPAFTEVFDWTMEEVEGRRIPFLPESERATTMACITEVLEKEKTVQGFETNRYTRDGRLISVDISASRYRNHEGKPSGMLVILRDTSEKKRLEAQLRQAHKMEAVGTLAGGIAHDFNNILQTISGYAQILLMEKEPGDPDYKSLGAIEKSAQRAGDLTKQLMIFSRKVESKLRPVDINQEVREISKMLERIILKMIDLELHLAENLKVINADPGQLEQIMMNLGVNARDAMPEGGKLIFETTNVVLDGEYCETHLGASPGEYVLLSISDTGHGMDKETLERIFEPFYTTKEMGKGTGLGLAMVYGIVKNHGGYITCYSEPGQGTTFKLYFPVVQAESIKQRLEQKEKCEIPGGTETILLVDDEEAVLDVVKSMLERSGYTTITAESGERAVEIFSKVHRSEGREEERRDKIDLVILDLGMPGMGGHKCLKELLKIHPKVKVVISSGYSESGKMKETLESGAAGFIGKPYRLVDMVKQVREILDKGEFRDVP
jgi:PAS domain S-box-containing protein